MARELPERRSGQTAGIVVDPDGTRTRLVSGRDPDSAQVLLALRNSPHWPQEQDGYPAAADHVESKAAMRMREQGITHAVVVVNNRMCAGDLDCYTAVQAILPVGYVLEVWEPGASAPKILRGKARP